jgi:hypothetical protein
MRPGAIGLLAVAPFRNEKSTSVSWVLLVVTPPWRENFAVALFFLHKCHKASPWVGLLVAKPGCICLYLSLHAIIEMKWTQLILFDVRNRTFGHYLVARNKVSMTLMAPCLVCFHSSMEWFTQDWFCGNQNAMMH